MKPDIFIGRNAELEYYQNGLEQSMDVPNAVPILYLKGGAAIGKKSFHSKLGKTLMADDSRGWIWIRPEQFWETSEPSDWLKLFHESVQTNLDFHTERWEKIRESFVQDPEQEEPEKIWIDVLKNKVVVPDDVEEGERPDTRVIFVLDSYPKWDAEKKKWFAEKMYKNLHAHKSVMDVRYLVSGKESLLESIDLDAYWKVKLTDINECVLSEISEEEISTFLSACNVSTDGAEDLHKRSQGMPASLKSMIEPLLDKANAAPPTPGFDALFKGLEERQVKWLVWAAHIAQITEESLNVSFDEKEAKEAFEWLIAYEGIKLKKYPDKYVFDGPVVNTILEWEEESAPLPFKEAERMAMEYQQIVAVIPKKEDREMLSKFSIFRHFNEELVKEIYPEEWEALMKYVRTHKDYIQPTDHNLKIVDDIYRTIKDYTKLIPIPHEPEYLEVIDKIWNEKRDTVIEEMAGAEKDLEEEEKHIVGVREELRELLGKIRGHEGALNKMKQNHMKRNQVAKPRKKYDFRAALYKAQIALGVTVEFLGILFLYLGILFADQLSYAYSALGIFLILAGFFWPYKKKMPVREPVAAAPVAKEAPKDPMFAVQSDKQLRLLNMELTNLENKRSILSRSIAKQRRAISALDSLLSEPYA